MCIVYFDTHLSAKVCTKSSEINGWLSVVYCYISELSESWKMCRCYFYSYKTIKWFSFWKRIKQKEERCYRSWFSFIKKLFLAMEFLFKWNLTREMNIRTIRKNISAELEGRCRPHLRGLLPALHRRLVFSLTLSPSPETLPKNPKAS